MANHIGMDLSELKILDRDLKLLSKPEKNKAMRKGFKKGADLLRDEVKKRAPVDKGVLKKDIKSGATAKTGRVYIVDKRLSSQKANWHEYGTSKMAAKPFIRTGFDAKENEAEKAVIEGITVAIDEVFLK